MQTPDPPASLVTPIGYRNNSCGYCHRDSGSFAYFASTTSFQPQFYQSLLNRGWRRSGTLLYKPDQRASCCPQFTIRLDSESFSASKDQRQAQNRFNRYILGESYTKEAARLYPKSRAEAKKRNTDFNLIERVHESENEQLQTPPDPGHSLVVTLESDNFTEEKYALFENYQRLVHKEPPSRITKDGFRSFLCSSPLPRLKETVDGRERRLGSYHQCYRIDGQLLAVGVLDLLPQCVSAVYFMYHESLSQYSPGKLGALREIALAQEAGYRWWYAGFYIHSCVKMRYKVDYTPQYLLDAESYAWDPLDDEMKTRLNDKKFVSLSRASSREGAQENATALSNVTDPTAQPRPMDETTDPMEMDDSPDGRSDSSSDDDVPNPTLPLYSRTMPGILTRHLLLTEIDLDHIKLRIRGQVAETKDLISWEESDMDNAHSIKGIIADLVAAVGPELAREMVVEFD